MCIAKFIKNSSYKLKFVNYNLNIIFIQLLDAIIDTVLIKIYNNLKVFK